MSPANHQSDDFLAHRARQWLAERAGSVAELLRQATVRRRLLIVCAGTLVCLYALSVLAYVLSIPDIGLRCAFTPEVNRVYREFLHDPDDPRGAKLVGDRIVRIGDHRVATWPEVLHALIDLRTDASTVVDDETALLAQEHTHVRLNGEELVRVEFAPEHGDAPFSLWCRVGRSPIEALLPSILWFFLKVGLFLVAALVFWKRPLDRSAAQFFLFSIMAFGAFLGGYHWWRIVTQPVLLLVFIVCSVLLPAVSLHFYLLFPRPHALLQRRPRLTLSVLYGVPLAFLVILLSGYFRVRWLYRGGPLSSGVDLALGALCDAFWERFGAAPGLEAGLALLLSHIYIYLAVAAFYYLAAVVCLINSYRTAADATERNQVRWILYGAMIALVPLGYSLYLAFLEPSDFGGGGASWPMFVASLIVTVAFAISITRYRLMQLDQLLGWSMGYFVVSFLAGLAYYTVVFLAALLSQWITRPSPLQALGVSSAALVFMLVLDWLRSRVKRALDRRFYREKHQLDRTLRRMSQAVAQLVDPPTLARRLLQTSAEVLGVSRGAVYLHEGNTPLYRLTDSLGPVPPLNELSSGCPLIEEAVARGTVAAQLRSGRPIDPADRQLRFLGAEVGHALMHEGQMLGLLLLGPKEMGPYAAEDLNLLAAFAQITALALVSAQGHQTIEVLNRDLQDKVAKIAEQQARILVLQTQLLNRAPANGDKVAGQDNGDSSPLEQPAGIVGSSAQVRQLLQLVRKVSPSQSAVLLTGESGTGKELLARALHENSPRVGKPFVKVHCAALSPGLLESELFGHVKGAFTGAHRDKVGRFELADGGTLFLDEIGDISLDVQTKLLRVLQEMTFERVGSSEPVTVDVRVIAATHQNLEELIRKGLFREDLYYRLNVISIPVLPLRERAEDIPELAMHFLKGYAQRNAKNVTHIDDDVLVILKGHAWPGNIRELENVIERAVVMAEAETVTTADLPPELFRQSEDGAESARELLRDAARTTTPGGGIQAERADRDRREREHLVRALAAARGNKAEAARDLGMARSTLVSRLKKHGLS